MRCLFLSFVLAVGIAQSQEPPKPDAKQQKAGAKQRGTEKVPIFVKTPAPTTQAERDYETYEKREKPANERKITDATVALAWITGVLALFTAGLWFATYRLVREAKDTAKRQLRAYLSIDGFPYVSHLDTTDNTIWWSIHPVWKNGGATPTTSLFLNTDASLRNEKLPDNFDFPGAPGETIRMLVGANATVTARTLAIKGADLMAVRDGTKFFYIWGWAKYKDIFPDTPERITRFCNHITHVTGNPRLHYNRDTNPVEITFSFYQENNCMDEGCQ